MENEMKQQLELFLQQNGFQMISSNLPEFTIFFQVENNLINVLQVIADKEGFFLTREQYDHIKETIIHLFEGRGFQNIHMLSLFITADREKGRLISAMDSFCWLLDPVEKQLLLYENQVVDFYGLRTKLEKWLTSLWENPAFYEEAPPEKKTFRMKISTHHTVTMGIVLLNIILFLICTFTGGLLYNIGELNAGRVFLLGEYYRLFTCMFLHADVNHLFSNMVMFYFLGEIVEKNLGHVRYAVLYFLSGIAGGFASMGYSMLLGVNSSSIGASGAIFGITGALLWLAIQKKGHLEYITLGKVLFLIIFSLYSGITGTNIDNAAHTGGLIAGFFITIVLTGRDKVFQ